MKRIYHHYEKWEDFLSGMWRVVSRQEEAELLPRAIAFTGNADLYGSYMDRVVVEWPISCEQNLTNDSMNRQAWVGHAACSMAINCPEYVTRRAWGMLTDKQRDEANERARAAIEAWMRRAGSDERQYELWPTRTSG